METLTSAFKEKLGVDVDSSNIYALLTKREVNMAEYRRNYFLCVFMDRDEVEVHKNAKKK